MTKRRVRAAASRAWLAAAVCAATVGCDSRTPDQRLPRKGPASRPASAEATPSTQPTGPQPRIQVDQPILDLGKRWSTEKSVKHDFVIRNAGEATLHIKHVGSSCGCTHVGPKDVKIEPGKTWKLSVELDLRRQQALVAHKIGILSNDPKQPKFVLVIRGVVRQPIAIKPHNAHFFGKVGKDESRQRTMTLKNNTDQPMDLKLARCVGETFSAKVEPITPGKEYRLVMTARPPYKPGVTAGRVELTTGLDLQPKLVIRPQAFRPPRVLVTPRVMTLPQPLPMGAKQTISVRNNGTSDVKVLRVATPLAGVKTDIKRLPNGKVHNVIVRFPNNLVLPKGGSQLVVHTNDSEFAEIKVTVIRRPSIPTRPASAR